MLYNRFFLLFYVMLSTLGARSQDLDYQISISPRLYVEHINVPQEAQKFLISKLSQVASNNGMASSTGGSRFIVTSNVVLLEREVSASSPPMFVNKLSVTFFIGDELTKDIFSSYSLILTGVGTSDVKAFTSAINKINPSSQDFSEFVSRGKSGIIRYYEANCNAIMNESKTLATSGSLDRSIQLLQNIPNAVSCKSESLSILKDLLQKKLNIECEKSLLQCRAIWASNPNYNGVLKMEPYLKSFNPLSACFDEVNVFLTEVQKRVLEVDKRNWEFQLVQLKTNQEREMYMLKTIRDIGVAYGENQPEVIVRNNFVGWW